MAGKSQANSFDSVVNQLQFHILTDKVDTCVLPFLKRCVPVLAKKQEPFIGGWTMYPPGPVPTTQDGLLSIKVAQHPALRSKHSGARFDILTQEWEDGRPGIKGLRVWFYFDNKADADTAIIKIIDMFKKANTKAQAIRHPDSQTAILFENSNENWVSAKLFLRKEKLGKSKYNILFVDGSDELDLW